MVDERQESISQNSTASNEDFIEKTILRSMNEGVITLECSGIIHTMNPAVTRILGFKEGQLRGHDFETALPNDPENEPFKEIFRQGLQDKYHIERKDVRFKRPDGQVVDLSVTSSSLQVDQCQPALQSVVVVFRDITAFKSLERMRMRAVNHLSHELRTPLAIINASVENLEGNCLTGEKSANSLHRIERNLERLVNIQSVVEEILDPPPFKPCAFPVVSFIEETLESLRQQASHRCVSLISRLEPLETDRIDPEVLRIVLNTLVKNAIENTPDNGQVTISLTRVEAGILLQVEDTGVGITLQDEEFIFEGFHCTQRTDEYSSKKPFDFDAGGKGLELLRLKVLSESGYFDIRFETRRCTYIPTNTDHCPGGISACAHVKDLHNCRQAGGTTFSVLFR
jgi:PAS domain S-box-containing protein